MGTYGLSMLAAALAGMGLGVLCCRAWSARVALDQRRIPGQWQLRTRALFTGVERTVWHWLEGVFFDHHVLVKTPVLRFLSPRSATQGQHLHELLQGVYCSFTICTPDGRVVGCVDVAGSMGLKASQRDVKKKLFDECGLVYAVLGTDQLPTLEALRTAFLGDPASAHPPGDGFASTSQMPLSQSDGMPATPVPAPASLLPQAAPPMTAVGSGTAPTGSQVSRPVLAQGIDMMVVAAARSSLQSKLDQNRKVRLVRLDEPGALPGIVQGRSEQTFAASWDDSLPMGEDGQTPDSRSH